MKYINVQKQIAITTRSNVWIGIREGGRCLICKKKKKREKSRDMKYH